MNEYRWSSMNRTNLNNVELQHLHPVRFVAHQALHYNFRYSLDGGFRGNENCELTSCNQI